MNGRHICLSFPPSAQFLVISRPHPFPLPPDTHTHCLPPGRSVIVDVIAPFNLCGRGLETISGFVDVVFHPGWSDHVVWRGHNLIEGGRHADHFG